MLVSPCSCIATAEVFADNASQTLLPMLVHRDDLALANSRIQAGFVTINQLVGPPLGAALFAAGMAWPFIGQAVLVAGGRAAGQPDRPSRRIAATGSRGTDLRHEIAEGFRWVRHHAGGADAGADDLHLQHHVRRGVVGARPVRHRSDSAWARSASGCSTTVSAARRPAGHRGSYGWITRRVSLGNIMRIGLIIETLTHLGLAITTVPAVAMAVFFVFGAHAFVWGTTSVTVRQRAVPSELQGRVGSVNTVGVFGGLVVGSALGGLLAQPSASRRRSGSRSSARPLFLVLIWRQLAHIAHEDEPDARA